MAVTSVKLKYNYKGSMSSDGKRSYSSVYLVESDDINDHASTIILADSLPKFGDLFLIGNSGDLGAYVQNKSAELVNEEEKRRLWHVTVEFSTADSKEDNEDDKTPDNPEDEAPEIQWGFVAVPRALDRDFLISSIPADPFDPPFAGGWFLNSDLSGKAPSNLFQGGRKRETRAVVNTAGEPFDPPLQYDFFVQTLTMSGNILNANFSVNTLAAVQGKINDEPYFGRKKYQVLCVGATATKRYRGPAKYWNVSYEFHLHTGDNIWYEPILNVGFTEFRKEGGLTSLSDFTADNRKLIQVGGEPANVPQLLDVDGVSVVADDAMLQNKAVYVPVYPYEAANFGNMRFKQGDLQDLI